MGLGYQAKTVKWGKLLVVEGDASDTSSMRFEHDNMLSHQIQSSSNWWQLRMSYSKIKFKIIAIVGKSEGCARKSVL